MPDPSNPGSRLVAAALAACPLYFILDESMFGAVDPLELGARAVQRGVRMLQLRTKSLSDRELLALGRQLRRNCGKDCLLIINDRPDIALLSGADGVHVGADDISVSEVRKFSGELIVGASAQTVESALAAEMAGAGYLGSGAVFSSPTKPARAVIGPGGLSAVARAVSIPVVAIGGITAGNCQQILETGASGYCAITPFGSIDSFESELDSFFRQPIGTAKPGANYAD